jgi:hypothetical protein
VKVIIYLNFYLVILDWKIVRKKRSLEKKKKKKFALWKKKVCKSKLFKVKLIHTMKGKNMISKEFKLFKKVLIAVAVMIQKFLFSIGLSNKDS